MTTMCRPSGVSPKTHGRPLDPLQSLDRDGRVLYVGTFSKVLVPSLRLGFVVAPASLAASLRAAKAVADAHGSPEAQRALASFIDDGRFGRHVRRLSRVYRERRERLAAEVARELGEEVTLLPAVAGLHQCVLFRDAAVDAAAIARRAREVGVIVQPLAPYYATRPRAGTGDARAGLCLGYGMIDAERIDEGIRRLAAALRPSPVTSPSSGKSWARGTSRRGSSRRAERRAVR